MTDILDLALTYGGFTSLDKVYLKNRLSKMDEEGQLAFITPPPSVVNAYFAEYYQKQGPEAATAYYLELSKALKLFGANSFDEESKPFIRLNLGNKAYGFSYINAQEEALVFAEKAEAITGQLLLEIAQLFPHYKVYQESEQIHLFPMRFDETGLVQQEEASYLLAQVFRSDRLVKIQGYNREDVLELASRFSGCFYYGFDQRQALIYISN